MEIEKIKQIIEGIMFAGGREVSVKELSSVLELTPENVEEIMQGVEGVVNDPEGTGYAAHRDDILLAGKTGTAELKATKEDTSGKEIGWFSVFTADKSVDKPILLISMVENVKGIGGSGYVVKKDATVLEEYFEK